jgi:hypothetical protein
MTGRQTVLTLLSICAVAFFLSVLHDDGSIPTTTEATTTCHGHSTDDGHWTIPTNVPQDELVFVGKLDKQLSQIDPTRASDPAGVLNVIDQFACKGVSREQTAANLIKMTTATADLKKN